MSSFPTIEILKLEDLKNAFLFSQSSEQSDVEEKVSLPTILVVDDERLVADTLSEVLKDAGYSVITAYDGWEALEMANRCRPAFLLTDVLMPRMNGVELAMALRRIQPSIRILLFSGNAGVSEIIDEGRKQGYEFDTLGKPVHPSMLLKRLSELK